MRRHGQKGTVGLAGNWKLFRTDPDRPPAHLIGYVLELRADIRSYAMRAVLLHEYGGPEKLKFEENVPEPQISKTTILIAAVAASVNPIDWKMRSGLRRKDFP